MAIRVLTEQKRSFSATTVAIKENDSSKIVVGYYTICPTEVRPERLSSKYSRAVPKCRPVSAILLCRIARDLQFKGTCLGEELLIHSLKKCVRHSTELGGYVVLVDALNKRVAEIYKEYGFKELKDNPLQLAIKMSDIKRNFGII
ncbi:Uncharacterized protein SCG7109_AD_00010 [Chlamydiales bacterium SCGC AG-110-M15]|nr:Uncharacterized protein SCG7109_AD_00010 [Chlamydiales bacterium SCGC AG-110-M15]